jgi:hypothetical protein
MREIRTSGSEGGVAQANAPSLPLSRSLSGMRMLTEQYWAGRPLGAQATGATGPHHEQAVRVSERWRATHLLRTRRKCWSSASTSRGSSTVSAMLARRISRNR